MTELFVTGLPFSASEEDILEKFTDYAECTSVNLQKNDEGRSKGRAFIKFHNEDQAQQVFDQRKEIEMDGRKLFIDFTGHKSVFGCKLFVKGLPYSASEEDVSTLDCFKGVESVEILRFDDGKSKGCGYLKFPTFEQAEEAFDRRNDAEMDGRRLWLDFTGPRSRFKARGFNNGGGGGFRNNNGYRNGQRGGGRGGYRSGGGYRNGGGDRNGYSNDRQRD